MHSDKEVLDIKIHPIFINTFCKVMETIQRGSWLLTLAEEYEEKRSVKKKVEENGKVLLYLCNFTGKQTSSSLTARLLCTCKIFPRFSDFPVTSQKTCSSYNSLFPLKTTHIFC